MSDMYESPIEIICNDISNGIQLKMENDICKALCSYGININRDELIKALNYDREQYEKGFEDARRQFQRQHGEWIIREDRTSFVNQFPRRWVECSCCEWSFSYDRIKDNFCSWCGADMRGDKND